MSLKKPIMHPAIPLTFDLLALAALISMFVIICMFAVYRSYSGYDQRCGYTKVDPDCSGHDWSSFVEHTENTGIAFLAVTT